MRNKAKNAAAKKAIGVGGNDSDSAGERKRLEHLRTKVCAVVLLSFLADRRLEACVRVSWMCCRRLADVSVIPEPLRRAVTAAGALTHVCVVWVPAQTREMLHGHRVRLVDAFRVFDSNNRGWLDETSAPHPHQTHSLASKLELDS